MRAIVHWLGRTIAYQVLVFLILWNGFENVIHLYVWPHWAEIDQKSYLTGALQMIRAGEWVYAKDTSHSVGMQVFVASVFRLLGTELPRAILWVNFLLWCAMLLLMVAFVRRLTHSYGWGLVAGYLFSESKALRAYCSLVQYEIPVGLLLILLVILNTSFSRRRALGSGLIIACLSAFRPHFSLLFFLGLAYYGLAERAKGQSPGGCTKVFLVTFLFLAIAWNGYYMSRLKRPYLFHLNLGKFAFKQNLGPQSTGLNFPYRDPGYPRGLSFIFQRPNQYLTLLGKRFQFLLGLREQPNFVESEWALRLQRWGVKDKRRARDYFVWGALLLFGTGWYVALCQPALRSTAVWCSFPIGVILFAQLFINSTSRFLVPILPLVILQQVLAIRRGLEGITWGTARVAVKVRSLPRPVWDGG